MQAGFHQILTAGGGVPFDVALIRHPRPLVAAGVCYGRLDLPPHPEAERQIGMALEALAAFTAGAVWSSPAVRCRGMADRLAAARGLSCRFDERLLELDFGAWEGLRWDDIPRRDLDRWSADVAGFAAPGGETGADLVARVTAFHAQLRQAGANCIVVGHGGPLKLLRALLEGRPAELLASPPAIGSVAVIRASAG